MHNMRAKRWVF